ncbi:MAG: DUF885 domain-containing protein [SAR86 cluster bacterium]|uniref:DUF885 domain-containing protein n=1 Tax=SAR86 cluster bacterium TaxID=2030880 RepID=A0A2A5B1M9_9GAMM|nr:MAG: DUF885 domain-containing protein [SAR86 cluster bacterium]
MRVILLSTILMFLVSCSDEGSSTESLSSDNINQSSDQLIAEESQHFLEWLDTEFEVGLEFSPLRKTRLGDKSNYGDLDDVSEAALDNALSWRRESVARMQSDFNRAGLDQQGQLSWDLWEYRLANQEASLPFRRHRFIFGRGGPQSGLPNSLINYQDVESQADMQAYISRLNQSGRYMLQYLERAKLAAADGIRAPFFDYQQAISEIERVTSGAPFSEDGDSDIWSDIIAKINTLREAGEINEQMAAQLQQQSQQALLNQFKPAYDEILAWLQVDKTNVSDQAEGAWALPNGEEYYQSRLAVMTTLPLTADEIHQLGITEVARIQSEMELIKRVVGFEGSLQEFFNFMREDDQFYYPTTDQGRQDYLNLADEILAEMYTRLPDFFGILPKAGLQVKRVESFREQAGGAAHYARGTKDGSRPGTFYVHLTDMRATAVNRLENLSYHEGVPGHHMQISIQQELENIPRFRANTGYTAFSEGWGLYAEFLGKEMGGYNDPYADFGRLSGEIWRAVRLVVDTGIHAKRWTQQQAVEYALQNSPRPELSVQSEIRRYFNNPGQATAYKIGMLKIQEVRAKAEEALGQDFDIKAFHDTVLGSGALPLEVLEAQVDRWIESSRD